MMRPSRSFRPLILALLLGAHAAVAQDDRSAAVALTPDTVLVARGDAVITLREFEAYLATIPEEHRRAVADSPERIAKILSNLVKNRLIALQAREDQVHEEPEVAAQLDLMADQVLARGQMERVAERAEPADFEQQAREYYLTHPDEFRTPEQVSVRHVLIGTKERSQDEARALAEQVAGRARSGEVPFEKLVAEYSDDPSKESNQGRFTFGRGGEMVKPFEEAAFALEDAGDVAGPVETRFGYHVIRLEEKHPPRQRTFDEVKSRLVAQAKERHAQRVRQEYLNTLLTENELEAEQEIIAALRDRYRRQEITKDRGTGGQ